MTASPVVIGDKIRDCAICESTSVHGFLIGSNEKPEVIEAVRRGEYERVQYAEDLLAAAQEIVKGFRIGCLSPEHLGNAI